MLKSYLRHLYRERRRFGLSALLLLGASALTPNALHDPIPHVSSEFIAIMLIFLAMPLISIYARKHRHFIEVFAFASLLLSIASHIAPSASFSLMDPDWDFTIVAGTYLALVLASYQFLYGAWSDPLTPKRTFRVVTKMRSTADIYNLWYGLIAMPGHRELYADKELVSVDYADPAHKVIRMIHWAPPRREEYLVFIEEMEKFERIKMRLKIVEGVVDNAADGVTEFRFRDNGRRRKVTMIFLADAVSPRRMLRHWLDDTVGRMMDNRVSAIEWNAKHPNDRRQPVSYDDWWMDTETVSKSANDSRSGYRTAHGRALSDQETKALEDEARKPHLSRRAA
ncbi:MAG: hypothetical protein P8X51_00880 [Maritimibacter sp.]